MEMNEGFIIDEAANQIRGAGILENEKIEGPTTVRMLTTLLYQENLLIFVRHFENRLTPVPQEELLAKWEIEYQKNLCLQEDCALEDFPNEYFYFVDLWRMKNGTKILVLSLNH
jgi:hypothetical protein